VRVQVAELFERVGYAFALSLGNALPDCGVASRLVPLALHLGNTGAEAIDFGEEGGGGAYDNE